MSRERKFDDVLDECLERLLIKNESIEQCLLSFPRHSAELKPLLETALATRQASAIKPRSEFRERARQQFDAALRDMDQKSVEQKESRVSFQWGRQRQWATAVAIVLVLSLAGGGTLAAASGSMPDSPLYGVKLASEQLQLALTFSPLGKAELHAKLADKRVSEIVYLAQKDKPQKIDLTTESLNNHLSEITALVSPPAVSVTVAPAFAPAAPTAPAAPQRQAAPETVPAPPQAAAPAKEPTRQAPIATAPTPAPTTEKAPAAQDEQTGKGASSTGESVVKGKEADPGADRKAKLKTTVENQADSNIARLRSLLETAPASTRPALQKAIAQSEAEYKKAIDALK